ncbi:MAG TPA: dephospho-CoA kinase [Steroidobacteraceae bacterium]|nr:dephospho-CoA kinase [Steroidobacteraceae bacterium]
MKRKRPLRIGLTGGIASGKTTVAELFAARGIPVIDTDQIARELVAPGSPALRGLVDAFGPAVLDAKGALDRRHLRGLVFADPAQRQRLEAILHPLILEEMMQRSEKAGGPYQILVIPLLAESARDADVDRVLVVDAPVELQIGRLLARDAENERQARAMIAAQATREQRLALADDVIVNDRDRAALDVAVAALDAKYRDLTRAGAPPRER